MKLYINNILCLTCSMRTRIPFIERFDIFFSSTSMILSAFMPFSYRYFFYLCSSLNIFEFCSLFCSVFFPIRVVQFSSVRFDSIRFGVTILLLFTHRSISMKHSREHVWKRVIFFFPKSNAPSIPPSSLASFAVTIFFVSCALPSKFVNISNSICSKNIEEGKLVSIYSVDLA